MVFQMPWDKPGTRWDNRRQSLSDDLANEIVFVGLGDLDVVDSAYLRFETFRDVVDQYVAVDLLGLALEAALVEEVGLLRETFENDGVGLADFRLIELFADHSLCLHQAVAAFYRDLWIDL